MQTKMNVAKGDKMYHPEFGEVMVEDVGCKGASIATELKDRIYRCYSSYALLSFTPWPEPNHIRPESAVD